MLSCSETNSIVVFRSSTTSLPSSVSIVCRSVILPHIVINQLSRRSNSSPSHLSLPSLSAPIDTHSINTVPIPRVNEADDVSTTDVVSPHAQPLSQTQPVSQIPEAQLSLYSSLELFSKRDNFSVGDGVLFWAFNKWQPISGCCKIMAIEPDSERAGSYLISIGSRDDFLICKIKECRVCWFPNWTSDNLLNFECVELDSSMKFADDVHKWHGQRLCSKHSRSYIPHDRGSLASFLRTGRAIWYLRETIPEQSDIKSNCCSKRWCE